MRITSKGQVTVPAWIRERFGLNEGTEVEFRIEGNTVVIVRAEGSETRGQRLVRRLRGSGSSGMSTAEIMELLRDDD
jgi:AbrB family looped-hinge helix DNA binding protein